MYAKEIKLEGKIIFSTLARDGDNIILNNFNAKIVGNPHEGHQGNTHQWKDRSNNLSVFYDDENFRKDLFVVSTNSGILSEKSNNSVKIPSPINSTKNLEAQPSFDGDYLYFRRELEILKAKWKGPNFSDKSSWRKPESVLKGEGFFAETSHIIGVGEPTIGIFNSKKELCFVYIIKSENNLFDLNIGRVKAR